MPQTHTPQIKKIIGSSRNRKYNHWNEEFCIQAKKQIRYSWEKIAELEDRAQRVKELENLKERRYVKCKKG